MRNWPTAQKIMANVVTDKNGCWIWQMSKSKAGYGSLHFRGETTNAHRVAWIEFRGEIPTGMHVLHKCDVRACCNPDHLFIGTHYDNMADMKSKGRSRCLSGEKNWNHKLTDAQVSEIRIRYQNGEKQTHLAKEFGVYQGSISAICRMASRKTTTGGVMQ